MSAVKPLVKHANLYKTTLNGDISAAALSMVVTSATGLPTITGSEYFRLLLKQNNAPLNREIVKVTGVAGATLTIVRAQGGTSAQAFSDGDTVLLPVDKDLLDDHYSELKTVIDFMQWADPTVANHANVATANSIAKIIADAGGANVTIHLRPGTYAFTSGYTVPLNVAIEADAGAFIHANNAVVSINGDIRAGVQDLLRKTGSGRTYVFNHRAYIEWFGAKGDGGTDDSAAFLRAKDETSHLVLSSRFGYNVMSNLAFTPAGPFQLEFLGTTAILVDALNTVTLNAYVSIVAPPYHILDKTGTWVGPINNQVIYPEWFGAEGNGVRNDTPEIQAAINFAGTGNTIQFSDGKTYLTKALTVTAQRTFRGGYLKAHNDTTGSLITVTGANGCRFSGMKIEVPNSVVIADCSGIHLDTANDTVIESCAFVGSKANGSLHAAIYGLDSLRPIIRDNSIQDTDENAISLDTCSMAVVTGNVIDDAGTPAGGAGHGIYVADGYDYMISGNTIADAVLEGIHIATPTVQAIVQGNNIHYSGRDGIAVDGTNIGILGNGIISIGNANSGVTIGANADNVRIIGNRITGYTGEAVEINAAVVGVSIYGNDLLGNTATITGAAAATSVKAGANLGIDDEAMFRYDTAVGVNGSALAAGWNVMPITTTVKAATWAVLAANRVTLQPGTYRVEATCNAYSNQVHNFRAAWYDVTAGAIYANGAGVKALGTSGYHHSNSPENAVSHLKFELTVAVARAYELQLYSNTAVANTFFGLATNDGVNQEVYGLIHIERIA